MTEPKEQELKPCKCGGNADLISSYDATSDWYFVRCEDCFRHAGAFLTPQEAIAAWNNYVDPAPAPKWTSEIPQDDRQYLVRFHNGSSVKTELVALFTNDGNMEITRFDKWGAGERYTDTLEYFLSIVSDVQWYAYPDPPLQAESER